MTTMTRVRDFKAADALLTGRNRDSRKVANNTYLVRRGEKIAVQLHATDVVTFHPDGSFTLSTGGWDTVTTRDRITTYSPARLHARKGETHVTVKGREYRMHDGITFGPRGGCRNPLPVRVAKKVDRDKAAKAKRIENYIDGWIETLVTGQMPMPSHADCWYCTGFLSGSDDHLSLHMSERYYVPSLIVAAAADKGYGNPVLVARYVLRIEPAENGTLDGSRTDLTATRRLLRTYLTKNA